MKNVTGASLARPFAGRSGESGLSLVAALVGLAILGTVMTGLYEFTNRNAQSLKAQRGAGQSTDFNTSALALVAQYFDADVMGVDCQGNSKNFVPRADIGVKAPALANKHFPGGAPVASLTITNCNPQSTKPEQILAAGGLTNVEATCPKMSTKVTVESFDCKKLWAVLKATAAATPQAPESELKARIVLRHTAPLLPIPPNTGLVVQRVGINVEDLPAPKWDRDFNDSVLCFGGDLLVSRQSGRLRIFSRSEQTIEVTLFSASACSHKSKVTLVNPDGTQVVKNYTDGSKTGGVSKRDTFPLQAGTEILWSLNSSGGCVSGLNLSDTTNVIVRADFCNLCPDRRIKGDCTKMPGSVLAKGGDF